MEPVQAVEEHLSRITHLLVANRSSDAVLQAVADALTDVAPYDVLTIHEIDSPLQILRPLMVRETRSGLLASLDAAPYGAGLGGLAVRSARPRLITGPSLPSDEGDGQPGSLVIVPLTTRDELRGVLSLARSSDQVPFTEEEFQAAVQLGELAALAIDSAQVRARLEIEGVTDTLTGLYNHRHFHERLAEEVRRAHRQRTSVGVLVLDIDDFRRINDTHGHLLGDQVLQGIATIARITCRLEDVLCRIGGEEFAIILPNCDVNSSAALAERLRQAVHATPFPSVGEVSISIGVAEGPRHASSSRELTACGQLALDAAKRSGKNRVCVYDESDGGLGPHWTISTNGSGFDGVFIPSSEDAGWPVAPERAERWRATYPWTSPGPSADGASNGNDYSNGGGNGHSSHFQPQVGSPNDDRSTDHVAGTYSTNGSGRGHPDGNGFDPGDPGGNEHPFHTPGSGPDGAEHHRDEGAGSRSSQDEGGQLRVEDPPAGTQARLVTLAAGGESRSLAHLRMLHSLTAKLNRLSDVAQIGEAITTELRGIIDYHNCRVHLLQPDGETLVPIAFKGELGEYQAETFDALIMKVGHGVTGHVAMTGETYYTANARTDDQAATIPGTEDVDESLLVVPLCYSERCIGTVALSKLGVDQFDIEDQRMLEVLASHAAVAFENARLFQDERESGRTALALLKLSRGLTSVADTEQVLRESLRAVPELLGCSQTQAWIRDPDSGEFHLGGHRGFPERYQEALRNRIVAPAIAAEFLLSLEEPFVLPKHIVAEIPAQHRLSDDIREVLVAPMRWEPDGLGMLVVIAPSVDQEFTPSDLRLARGIADITSLALGNARRFDELERAYVSTVEALANALEAKDEYTEDHCRALARMSMAIGAELGFADEELKTLELGALFHDIGKIGIPSEIIRKPAPLTAAERQIMNKHTIIGEQILAPVPFLQPVRPIIRSSHERWDGEGYPDALTGEDIPLASRIVCVCDAYHAMTSDRPYRSALPEREAIRRLKQAAGTQFDPHVVEAFVRVHERGDLHTH